MKSQWKAWVFIMKAHALYIVLMSGPAVMISIIMVQNDGSDTQSMTETGLHEKHKKVQVKCLF